MNQKKLRHRIEQAIAEGWSELDLSDTKLTSLPPEIGQLTNLTQLDLSFNKLTSLPPEIGQLTNLIQLDLSFNKLTSLPPEISQLISLIQLDLSNTNLTSLPPEIGQLTNLTQLDLRNTKLTSLLPEIGQLTNLTQLDLSNINLKSLLPEIGQLTSLIQLNLSNTNLKSLPPEIGQLTSLTKIYIAEEDAFSGWLRDKGLHLDNNPLEIPPPEVAAQGIAAIKTYFEQLEEVGMAPLYEAKLLIVGEPGAGKTSLAKKIDDPDYQLQPDEKTTQGIDVIQWQFPFDDDHPFQVNIWDFGGQEIYHATHQFFLTKRSLYLLVADTRQEDTDFYYWLNVVELLSDNSPLLIIKNEKQDRHREINERRLRGRFTNLKETLPTNLSDNRGLDNILSQIRHHISHLPHIGAKLPKTWIQVRRALEDDPRNYIPLEEYLDICTQNGITAPDYQRQLSRYLHDLGVCLHFQDDDLLDRTVILKPEWGTEAVYRVLDNPTVIRNLGRFTRSDLATIWHEEKYIRMRPELLQLMLNFQLCYQIPTTNDTYIAPQLLTENQLEYTWPEGDTLHLRYTYDFMPKGIILRFIVILHRYIARQRYVWRSGVLLTKDQTGAEVIEDQDRRQINIRAVGQYKKELLTIITHELDEIHANYHNLQYNKLIPCNCSTCKNNQQSTFYPFERLRKFIFDKQDRIQCPESYEMVNVRNLIDDVIDIKHLPATDPLSPIYDFREAMLVNPKFQLTKKGDVTMTDQSNTSAGDTFNMSGDFRGAILNIKSTLDNVSQSVGALPNADQTVKDELRALIDQLNETLQQAPEGKDEAAVAVAQSAEMLVKTATEEKPNKAMVQITGEGLKQAAQNLADVMPNVLTIATSIVTTVAKLIG